jgi:hypothetical protein
MLSRRAFVAISVPAVAVAAGAQGKNRAVPIQNKTTPGKDVVRVEVMAAVDRVRNAKKTLTVCVQIKPLVPNRVVSGKLELVYGGKGKPKNSMNQHGFDLRPGDVDLLLFRGPCDVKDGNGELDKLSGEVSSVETRDP